MSTLSSTQVAALRSYRTAARMKMMQGSNRLNMRRVQLYAQQRAILTSSSLRKPSPKCHDMLCIGSKIRVLLPLSCHGSIVPVNSFRASTTNTGIVDPIKTTKNERTVSSNVQAYLDLAKFRLSSLVVVTTGAGFLAAGGPVATPVLSCSLLGTFLCAASAAAYNQVLEVPRDALMKRTQPRPLVTGALTPVQATYAAHTWGAAGVATLWAGTDPLTAALGLANIVLYAGVYTNIKPISTANTWVGAVVGAIPPVMGYTAAVAATGDTSLSTLLHPTPLYLAATLFCWQMPHFFALSYMHRLDYLRGGMQMVPCLELQGPQQGARTARLVVRYTWYLVALPLWATGAGLVHPMFGLESVALNAYALHVAYQFQQDRTNARARRVFLTSLWYLPCVLTLFLLHATVWDSQEERIKDDVVMQTILHYIYQTRDLGRELCVHEYMAAATESIEKNNAAAESSCPVTLIKRQSHVVKAAVESTAALSTTAAEGSCPVAAAAPAPPAPPQC
jgi:heme o synthase